MNLEIIITQELIYFNHQNVGNPKIEVKVAFLSPQFAKNYVTQRTHLHFLGSPFKLLYFFRGFVLMKSLIKWFKVRTMT